MENGIPKISRYEAGLPVFVNSDMVVQVLNNNLHGIRTLSGMIDCLKELKYDYPWINQVLHWLDKTHNDYDKDFSSQFFKVFRSSKSQYVKIYSYEEGEDDDKITKFVITPVNKSVKVRQKLDDVKQAFLNGENTGIFSIQDGETDLVFDQGSIETLKDFEIALREIAGPKTPKLNKEDKAYAVETILGGGRDFPTGLL
jgi:hypothetical protein